MGASLAVLSTGRKGGGWWRGRNENKEEDGGKTVRKERVGWALARGVIEERERGKGDLQASGSTWQVFNSERIFLYT